MTLPKYLNYFRRSGLEEKSLKQGDLVKVAQGNGLAVDVVGMRLDDVKKIKGPKELKFVLPLKVDGTLSHFDH
jgi:hypothetical protein